MYDKVNGWLTSFFYFVFRTMGTAFKFWAQKTASRGHSCSLQVRGILSSL